MDADAMDSGVTDSGATDWDALAAQVMEHYAETGTWWI